MDPVGHLFPARRRSRTTRVGLEHELLTRHRLDGTTADPAAVRAAVAGRSYADRLTFEPGGQVELVVGCTTGPHEVARRLGTDVLALGRDLAGIDVEVLAEPVDRRPLSAAPLRLRNPRYLGMQAHFDTIGPAGRQMMRQTASTQVCLDWWSGQAGHDQWRLLNLAGPFLAAAYARSAGPGSRLDTWLAVDPGRTAFDDRLLTDEDPVRAYAAFAAGATRFVEPAQHLSTLFPPVRPRGRYLEVRHLDVQPLDRVAEVVEVLAGLAYDDGVRTRVLRELEPERPLLADLWRAAADGDPGVVLRGRELAATALGCGVAA